MKHLWLRAEHRENEKRVGLTPQGAAQLNENGKLIAIIRPSNIKIGKAKLFFKISNEIGLENLFDAQVSKLSIFKS